MIMDKKVNPKYYIGHIIYYKLYKKLSFILHVHIIKLILEGKEIMNAGFTIMAI